MNFRSITWLIAGLTTVLAEAGLMPLVAAGTTHPDAAPSVAMEHAGTADIVHAIVGVTFLVVAVIDHFSPPPSPPN